MNQVFALWLQVVTDHQLHFPVAGVSEKVCCRRLFDCQTKQDLPG